MKTAILGGDGFCGWPASLHLSAVLGHEVTTVDNNVNATHNLLCAVVESGLDVHVVHLGTMGVYG